MTRRNEQVISWVAAVFLLPLIPFLIIIWSEYEVYISMTKSKGAPLTKSSFKQFKRGFNKVDWYASAEFNGLFDDTNENQYYNYIHASIWRMFGVGYILTPYGYFMASRLIRRKIKQLRAENPSMNRYVKLKD